MYALISNQLKLPIYTFSLTSPPRCKKRFYQGRGSWQYWEQIGETGRNLNIRLTEHKQVTKNVNNHIAEHHLHTSRRIDWNSAECVTYSTDY